MTRRRRISHIVLFFVFTMMLSLSAYAKTSSKLYSNDAKAYRTMMSSYLKDYNFGEAKYAIADINGDGRKDVVITNIAQGAGGYDTPRLTYILLKSGRKYITRKIEGIIMKAGNLKV